MTPAQYRAAIERLGLNQLQAAAAIGVSERTGRAYALGETIPSRSARLLLYLFLADRKNLKRVREALNGDPKTNP